MQYITTPPLQRNGRSPWGACCICKAPIWTSYRQVTILRVGKRTFTAKAHDRCIEARRKGKPA